MDQPVELNAASEPVDSPVGAATLPPHEPTPLPPAKPRVWPSLLIVPVTIVAILIGQVVAGISFAVLYQFEPADGSVDMATRLLSDVRFLTISLLLNFTIIASAAITAALLSRQRTAQRLALTRPKGPLWIWPLLIGGSCFVWGGVTSLMPLVFPEANDHLIVVREMMVRLAQSNPLLLILLIAVLPPIVEELLVRGYVQSRLVRRLGPLVGIALASISFAVLHMDVQHSLGVLPIGIWIGFVAWRMDSVFPAVVCHAVNNGCAAFLLISNVDLITTLQAEAADNPDAVMPTVWDLMPVSMVSFMTVSGVAFVAAVVALLLTTRPAHQ